MGVSKLPMHFIPLVGKVWPPFKDAMALISDPHSLHYAMHMMVATLEKGLEDDHRDEVGNRHLCERASSTTLGEEGPKSIFGWGDRRWQEHTDRGADGGIPSSVLGAETSSEGTDL